MKTWQSIHIMKFRCDVVAFQQHSAGPHLNLYSATDTQWGWGVGVGGYSQSLLLPRHGRSIYRLAPKISGISGILQFFFFEILATLKNYSQSVP